MSWAKAPQEMTDWLAVRMEGFPVERRPMFGCPTWFCNGNMFTSVHNGMIMLRLSADDQKAMMGQFPGVKPFVAVNMRPMKDYVMFPPELFAKTGELEAWFQKGFENVAALPPKESKKKKA